MTKSSETLSRSQNPPSEPKTNVLLVDDRQANLITLRAVLEELDQNLVDAHSGDEAIQRARSGDFAVILLDVLMPGIDGFETAQLIRGNARSRYTPIIFLTANDIEREDFERGYALGAVDFLVKPIMPVVLRAKVRGFVELYMEKQRTRREADQLRLLVNSTNDYVIFMLDPDGRVVTWNAGAERLKGYSSEEIIGRHFSCFYPPDGNGQARPLHELDIARREGRFEDEGWRLRRDGTRFWANVIITAIYDEAGSFKGFSKITRDLTERKRLEENARILAEESAARRGAEEKARLIQEERERLRVTLASIGDAVISTDDQGRVTFLNPVAERLVGWTAAEATSRALTDVFHIVNEKTRKKVENPALRALQEGKAVGLANHTILISRDGTNCPIDDSAAPIRDADNKVIGSVLVFRDVTERKRAESALQESAARFRQLADAMPHIVWTAQPDGNIDYLNRRWTEFSGLPDTIGSAGWGQLLHPDDASAARERWTSSVQNGLPFEMEIRLLDRTQQSYRWHLIRTAAAHDESGSVVRWFGTSTDIHEQKCAEEAARYLAAASAALAGVIDYESTLQKVAKLAVPYFADWSAVDLVKDGTLRRLAVAHQNPEKVQLALDLMRLYPPDPSQKGGIGAAFRMGKPEIMCNLTDELLVKGAKDDRHLSLLRSLGLKSYICVPLVVSGQPIGVLTFATAESGRRYSDSDLALALDLANRAAIAIENTQLYQALRDNDRRKDEFLATLAHELRNPLAPIRNSLQILRMPQLDAATAERSREMMERQVQQLVRLVDDLLDVSRVMRGKIELRKEPVELASIVARAVETAQPLIEAQAHDLILNLTSESLLLNADPMRLSQVVGNLLTNASKYTDRNGRIWLTARRNGNEAELSVRDTGIGIGTDMLPHIFELFVQADHSSTKAQGGLGIGLTLVKNLVEMHEGTVEVHSAGLGQGCEFVIRLPLTMQTYSEPREREIDPKLQTIAGLRLLVVDDNPDAAHSLATLLQFQGHEVNVAHDGVTALRLLAATRHDLVFLDIGMPGMDGYEVARRIRNTPGLENVVLAALTGWGQTEDRRRTAEAGFNHHLVKPAELEALKQVLTDVPLRGTDRQR